jgi:hypothetical protein
MSFILQTKKKSNQIKSNRSIHHAESCQYFFRCFDSSQRRLPRQLFGVVHRCRFDCEIGALFNIIAVIVQWRCDFICHLFKTQSILSQKCTTTGVWCGRSRLPPTNAIVTRAPADAAPMPGLPLESLVATHAMSPITPIHDLKKHSHITKTMVNNGVCCLADFGR